MGKLRAAPSKKRMQILLFRKAQNCQLKQCLYPGLASAAAVPGEAGGRSAGTAPHGVRRLPQRTRRSQLPARAAHLSV